jgi:hypothetical protein
MNTDPEMYTRPLADTLRVLIELSNVNSYFTPTEAEVRIRAECPNDAEHSLMDVFVSVPAFRSGLLYMLSPYDVVRLMEANDVSYREGLTRAEVVTYMPIYRNLLTIHTTTIFHMFEYRLRYGIKGDMPAITVDEVEAKYRDTIKHKRADVQQSAYRITVVGNIVNLMPRVLSRTY